jgi:hypothetical protein
MESLISFPVGLLHPLQHAGFSPALSELPTILEFRDAKRVPTTNSVFRHWKTVKSAFDKMKGISD